MFSQIGPLEIILVLVIALVILGPRKLPEAGRSIGKGMREFRDSITGDSKHDDEPELTATTATPAPAPAPVREREIV